MDNTLRLNVVRWWVTLPDHPSYARFLAMEDEGIEYLRIENSGGIDVSASCVPVSVRCDGAVVVHLEEAEAIARPDNVQIVFVDGPRVPVCRRDLRALRAADAPRRL